MFRFGIYIFVVVLAATTWSRPASDEKNEGEEKYCHLAGFSIKEGETAPSPIGSCLTYTCEQLNGSTHISFFTCSEWQLAPNSKCRKSEIDLTKQYPDCCPQEICDLKEVM